MMARIAEYRSDTAGTLTTGGSSTAYTLTTNTVFTTLALMSGSRLSVKFNATNGASPTLAVDGLTAKAISTVAGTAVPAGFILANTIWDLVYDNSNNAWVLIGPASSVLPGIILPYPGTAAPVGYLLCYGQLISRATYADLFAVVGTTISSGDGSTFGIPDLRDRTIYGKGNMGGSAANRITSAVTFDSTVLGGTGGAQSGTIGQTHLPSVTLTTSIAEGQGSHAHNIGITNNKTDAAGGATVLSNELSTINTASQALPAMSGTTPLGGSATTFPYLSPGMALNYIIKI